MNNISIWAFQKDYPVLFQVYWADKKNWEIAKDHERLNNVIFIIQESKSLHKTTLQPDMTTTN